MPQDDGVYPDKGIYPKYVVFKHPDFVPELIEAVAYPERGDRDGFIAPQLIMPIKEFVFVLKPRTDPHARVAIAAYAESVRYDKPILSSELRQIISDHH